VLTRVFAAFIAFAFSAFVQIDAGGFATDLRHSKVLRSSRKCLRSQPMGWPLITPRAVTYAESNFPESDRKEDVRV
jgi:hypothetical protein